MKTRFIYLLIFLIPAAILTGCAGRNGGNGGQVSPGGLSQSDCPVAGLSQAQLQQLVFDVDQPDDSAGSNEQLLQRAGKLAYNLSQLGVAESTMRASMQDGKFAALVSWLVQPQSSDFKIDFNAFKKCEENPNAN